jgi:short-subunit dehydrogenase
VTQRPSVVVVGASSGVGRATALMFARNGSDVVLAARDRAALDVVAARCRELGVVATVVETDIADASAVDRLREIAVTSLGQVDTWVNCASVLLSGHLGTESVEELRRVVDIDVTGTMLASRAAMGIFREQRHGVLINVSSLLGVVPNPLVPVYCASKFAIRGLSLCLHHEARRLPGVHVCTVLPGPVDTPMFTSAANHTGRRLRAIPPAMSAERVAARIVRCARRPRREATIGVTGRAIWLGHRVAPALTEWIVAETSARLLLQPLPSEDTDGNLIAPTAPARTNGGWRRGRVRSRIGDAVGRRLGNERQGARRTPSRPTARA